MDINPLFSMTWFDNLKHTPKLRAASLGPSHLARDSWLAVWRAAGLPQVAVGTMLPYLYTKCVVSNVDLRKGGYHMVPCHNKPLRPMDLCALRNQPRTDFDAAAACLAAAAGSARALAACPPKALLAHDDRLWSPAHYAAAYGHAKCLRAIARVAPAALLMWDGGTPAHATNDVTCIRVFAELAPSVFLRADDEGDVLAHAVDDVEILEIIAEAAPTSLHAVNLDGDTPAHVAASYDDVNSLRCLGRLAPDAFWVPNMVGCVPGTVAGITERCIQVCKSVRANE